MKEYKVELTEDEIYHLIDLLKIRRKEIEQSDSFIFKSENYKKQQALEFDIMIISSLEEGLKNANTND